MRRMCWWKPKSSFTPDPLFYHREIQTLATSSDSVLTVKEGIEVWVPKRYFRYVGKKIYVHKNTYEYYRERKILSMKTEINFA